MNIIIEHFRRRIAGDEILSHDSTLIISLNEAIHGEIFNEK